MFEADLTKNDIFVQSRLKPAWRASRAENLLKFDLFDQNVSARWDNINRSGNVDPSIVVDK